MPKIPEFQRRQLASSAVGTPGVDNSGEMIGTSLANSATKAFSAVNTLQKERQRVQDNVVTAKAQMDLQRAVEQSTLQHDEEYADFTGPLEERVKVYEEKLRGGYNTILESLPEGAARDDFSLKGQDYVNRAVVRQMGTADRNRALIAHKTTVDSLDLMASDIAQLGANPGVPFSDKQNAIMEKLSLANNLFVGGHLTTEDKITLRKATPEMAAKAYASTALLKNPAEVIQMIDSGVFGKNLDPGVASKIKEEAVAALPAFKEKAELMAALSDGKTFSGILQKIATGDSSGAAIELANLPDSKAVRVFREQLYKTKLNEQNDPLQEGRLHDRFLQLEVDNKTKTAKANALDIVEYMTDLSKTATEGGINKRTFNTLLSNAVVPFLAKIGDDKPVLANVHATGWQAVNRFFGRDPADPTGKTKEAVEVYNDFATILGEQPKITSETTTAALRQALGNYARKINPELAFMVELPDATMRPNGAPQKVGVGSEKKADQRIDDEAVLLTREGVTKLFPKSKEKALLANQWKRADGNG